MLAGSRERRPDGDGAAALSSYCLILCRSSYNLHLEVTDYSYRHFLFVDTSRRETFLVLVCVKKKRKKRKTSVSLPIRRFVSDPRRSSACSIRVNLKTFCIRV